MSGSGRIPAVPPSYLPSEDLIHLLWLINEPTAVRQTGDRLHFRDTSLLYIGSGEIKCCLALQANYLYLSHMTRVDVP